MNGIDGLIEVVDYWNDIEKRHLPSFLQSMPLTEDNLKITMLILLLWLRKQIPGQESTFEDGAPFKAGLEAILERSDLGEVLEYDYATDTMHFRPEISISVRAALIDYAAENFTAMLNA